MPTHPEPSDRLRLEVAVLADPGPAPLPPAPVADPAALRRVLIATGDPELDRYAADCLRECPGVGVHTPRAGESALEAARRLPASLLIAAPAVLGAPAAPPPLPLLLIVEDAAEAAPWRHPPGLRLAVLVLPFNARRLRAAAERLLPDAPPR